MNHKSRLFVIVLVVLLILSVSYNIHFYQKSERVESALELSVQYFNTNYRIDSIHRMIEYAIQEGKLYFGEAGKPVNIYQSEFQHISSMHRELTLLYGPIHNYEHYDQISSIGAGNTMFELFVDFGVFFESLYTIHSDYLSDSQEGLYLPIQGLDVEIRNGLDLMRRITGDLSAIHSEAFKGKTSDSLDALKQYLQQSADYYHSAEVQLMISDLIRLKQKLIMQASIS